MCEVYLCVPLNISVYLCACMEARGGCWAFCSLLLSIFYFWNPLSMKFELRWQPESPRNPPVFAFHGFRAALYRFLCGYWITSSCGRIRSQPVLLNQNQSKAKVENGSSVFLSAAKVFVLHSFYQQYLMRHLHYLVQFPPVSWRAIPWNYRWWGSRAMWYNNPR